MPDRLPDNYNEVLREANYRKKCSITRWELMLPKIEAVLNGEQINGEFEGWTSEDAKKLQEDLAKR